MQVLEAAVAANPWPLRRARAAELAERYPHAAEMLRLYQALIGHLPPPLAGEGQGGGIASLAVEHVLPGVIDATVEVGPRALRDGVIAVYASANLEDMIQRWLDQQPLNPFETYLARASASPLLEALTTSTSAISHPPLAGEGQGGGMSQHCPNCGGLPQLAYFSVSGEAPLRAPPYPVYSRGR